MIVLAVIVDGRDAFIDALFIDALLRLLDDFVDATSGHQGGGG